MEFKKGNNMSEFNKKLNNTIKRLEMELEYLDSNTFPNTNIRVKGIIFGLRMAKEIYINALEDNK